ncbi:deoxyribose-phosphate aldolase [Algibacter mikhailovii]|uniref:Deoxyribose-phosphate aldolase n=1 Tax=Algibacter mikhailovii TaxID=425498 RepID=A0A918RCS2_9FLAO|nr:deoxyribose-phosphate aldolase [Algibacter mikhailovii]GGZ94028.1 deoxyribose-phosphate aldolase 1 [Algibacter mikhailovii]
MNISKHIDYTLLDSTTTQRDIIALCEKALEYNYHSVCVSSCYVPLAKEFLSKSNVKVSTVVGFPFGSSSTKVKVYEAKQAIVDGAEEIGMVINLGYLKSKNYVSILKDITDVKRIIGKHPLKVIIEISELNKNEIIKASEICLDGRADMIETSTGFSKSGATLTAIKIIKKTIKNRAQIKATGDIFDIETALKYLEIGTDRIGAFTAINPVNNARQIRTSKIYRKYLEKGQETPNSELNKTTNKTTL